MSNILIVGGGATGALTAAFIRQQIPKVASVSIWEKSRGTGGRMSTSRSPLHPKCSVDIGAQYISVRPEYQVKHKHVYDELLGSQCLKPMSSIIEGDRFGEGTHHFVAPEGLSSVVKHIIKKSEAKVNFDHLVTEITMVNHDTQWKVKTNNEITDVFDAIVLTIPVPQLFGIKGTLEDIFDTKTEMRDELAKVNYSSRFSLGLFYEPGVEIDMPWAAKYFPGGECIVFVSIDNKKRGIDQPEGGPSVVVHTGVPYALKHLEEEQQHVQDMVMEEVKKLLPNLPEPSHIKCHKWRYSQVHHGVEGAPGCMVVENKPLMVLGGDAFTHSNFEGCVKSATKICETLKSSL